MALLKSGFSGTATASAGMGSSANRSAAGKGGAAAGPGGWEPTVLYLLFLTVLEVIAVAILSRHLLK